MVTGPEVIRLANAFGNLYGLLEEDAQREEIISEAERLADITERLYRNYDIDVDRRLWSAMFNVYSEYVPAEDLPGVFTTITDEFGNDFDAYATSVF